MSNLNFGSSATTEDFSSACPVTFLPLYYFLVIALLLGGGIFAFSHFVLKQKPDHCQLRPLPLRQTANQIRTSLPLHKNRIPLTH